MSPGCFGEEVGAGVLLSLVALGLGVECPPGAGSAALPPGRSFSGDRGVRKQPAAVSGKGREERCEK